MQKEIDKFQRLINAAKLRNNHKELIELNNVVGGLHSEMGRYEEAIHFHKEALDSSKILGDRLLTAIAFRHIGEAEAAVGNFFQAIDYTKRYLDLAQKTNDTVEIQRAWTTLGRVYLMQAQELKDKGNVVDNKIKDVAREAEKRFQTAINLAKSIKDQIDGKEFAQMNGGLLINLGLIKDLLGQSDEAIIKLNRAVEICRSARLKEDLYRCQIILAGLFRQKNNIKLAAKTSEDALQTAKSIGKKILICDALIERGFVSICQRDFKTAKRTFAQAYLSKSPSEEDHAKAIRLTKLTHLISDAYDKIHRDNTPGETKLKLCDKLGDLFTAINNHKLAVEFYRRAYEDAKVCSKPKSVQANILYSVAEAYADDNQFEHALLCYLKELTLREQEEERCQSLIKIAHMHEYLNHEPAKVCDAYEKAYEMAGKNPKLMHTVLKDYVPFMKDKSFNPTRCRRLEEILLNLKSYPEVMEIEAEDSDDVNDLEDEVANVDDVITDDEDNDEVLMVGKRRARGTTKFKRNEVGDTPLHEACIKNDLKRVRSLINQGHEVNPKDNAGWVPLHEACNHGHYQIAEYLIEHGADVNARGLKGMSPLHDAATNGHYEIMRLLMKHGANVIALTDTGESVLGCLRDYKRRNYSEMSNRDRTEYDHIEVDLMNVMDRCGANLMAENKKNSNPQNSRGGAPHTDEIRPKPRNLKINIDRPLSNPVKDYRDAIGTLKRKRLNDDEPGDVVKKGPQPATYHSSMSTSASTKEWLIDDVSRQQQVVKRRSNIRELLESNDEMSDDDVREVSPPKNESSRKRCSKDPTKDRSDRSKKMTLDSDDEEDLFGRNNQGSKLKENDDNDNDVQVIRESPDINVNVTPSLPNFGRVSSDSIDFISNSSTDRTNMSNNKRFDLFNQPLVVVIEDRKLLIPVKDEHTTIKELKKSIVDRYTILVNAEPNISLTPKSEPNCLLFDDDLCKDVICESVVATIESWKLKSIEDSYIDNCSKLKIDPIDFIKVELAGLNEVSNKLDLSYMRIPKAHRGPLLRALARRDFTSANFTGTAALFECQKSAQEILETITSWSKLTRLNLKCTGLMRAQFESICGSRQKLPELLELDVSVNSIAYKSQGDFTCQVEKLRQTCCKLRRLCVDRNHLQFVKSILGGPSTIVARANTTKERSSRIEVGGDEGHEADLSEVLGLSKLGIGIYGFNQNEYSVYMA